MKNFLMKKNLQAIYRALLDRMDFKKDEPL